MANELYRTYEVLVEESIHPDHPKRAKDRTRKESKFNEEIDGALRDTHMIFQDAVCYYTLLFAGLAGNAQRPAKQGEEQQPLNPLWKHLTSPRTQGGINDETERVIQRLATHYKPLEGITTAEEFLNRVYSAPLRIHDEMTDEQKARVLEKRNACYQMLESAARDKKTGELNCEGMSPFTKTWAGLLCVGKNASIPSELPYARFAAEFVESLEPSTSDDELRQLLGKTTEAYRVAAEDETAQEIERRFEREVSDLKQTIANMEALPAENRGREVKLVAARKRLEEFQTGKQHWLDKLRADLRTDLAADVHEAVSQRFLKSTTAAKLGMSEEEFAEAQAQAQSATTASKTFFRFREPPVGRQNKLEAAVFRYWLLHDHQNVSVRRAAAREFRWLIEQSAPKVSSSAEGKSEAKMPFVPDEKFAFRFFGRQCLEISKPGADISSPSRELDVAAFQSAIEDVFKYKIRTEERARKVARLLTIVGAFEGSGALSSEESPTGKRIVGIGDNSRWLGDGKTRKGIVDLLMKLSEGKEIVTYGLREGTIGGWAEVRTRFLKLHKDARDKDGTVADENGLVAALVSAVDEEMEANRQGFGSADFFHELCDPEFWHLWLDTPEYTRSGIKDFVPHYVTYCEHREDLAELLRAEDGTELDGRKRLADLDQERLMRKPIRYTWPGLLNRHKKPSYRYYDFAGDLNSRFQFKSLFRRARAKGADGKPTGPVEEYTQFKGDDAKVTLAARRLKRDKILQKGQSGEWSSVDALWCPPLILAGEANPTSESKPRAGKEKKKATDEAEVSFSLMAAPLPGDPWMTFAGDSFVAPAVAEPVHLTVSFKIEGDEIAKLQNEGVFFVRRSAKGTEEEDDKRRFLRWPIDIETDKQAAKDKAAREKREAKEAGKSQKEKTSREGDVAPSKLWCAYDGGFRVKQGHFSPEADIKRVPDFHILSIDLGNRFAAAFTRLRIHAGPGGDGRVISADGFTPVIKAEVTREGTLRLQGENAKVWDHVRNEGGSCKRDANGNYVYALDDETYGNGGRGRFPTDDEYSNLFVPLAVHLVPASALALAGKEQTYPELGDHLVFRLKRRIGRLRTLFNLVWRLCAEHQRDQQTGTKGKKRDEGDQLFHRRIVVETLARSAFPKRPRQPGEEEEPGDRTLRTTLAPEAQWQRLKADGLLDGEKGAKEAKRQTDLENLLKDNAVWNWDALAAAVKTQIKDCVEGGTDKRKEPPLSELVARVVEFCLPLRGRHWKWNQGARGERLTWGDDNSAPDWQPNVMGMRGLSMRRLEQILNLRQRCQSFAKLEDRYHGPYKARNFNPPDSSPDDRPDSCPKLLERSNRIREQRVDQTAHLILAEALGMELKNPAEVEKKKERKAEVDLHGEYQRRTDTNGRPYPRCSVIVLENLDRYKMSLGRTKSENSRLMKWAHGKILDKLEDMCRPFGITIMLVDPAFSSHFDSRTGLPGVRVNEVSRGFDQEYPYKLWKEGKTKGIKLAEDIEKLAADFAANDKFTGTLLLAVEGGKEFVPVAYPLGGEGIINADICAAGNIGLRGVADPQRWDVFPRLRTRQISETEEVSVTNWRGWFGKFPQDTKEKKSEQRRLRKAVTDGAPAKSDANSSTASAAEENADSQTSQSSEYPPYFVAHPEHDWGVGLSDKAFKFVQEGKEVLAYPQGGYLKRVEHVCSKRIQEINRARIQKRERGNDDVPM